MRSASRLTGYATLILACLATAARADIIRLKTGQVEGTIIEQTDTELVVETKVGKVTLNRGDVLSIEHKASSLDVYREMAAKVGEKDAEGHFALGRWATDHRLYREARLEYEKTIAIDPDHKGARERLGFVPKDGKWMTRSEAKQADGFVQFEGNWVTAEQRDAILRRRAIANGIARLRRAVDAGTMTVDAVTKRLLAVIGTKGGENADTALRALLHDMIKEANDASRDRLGEARVALVGLVAQQKAAEAVDLIRQTAVQDRDAAVRAAAIKLLAGQRDVANTAFFVGVLRQYTADRYRLNGTKQTRNLARRVLRRAGDALAELADPRAIPALANALIVRFHLAENTDELPPMSVGFSTNAMAGMPTFVTDAHGNQYVVPVTEGTNWGLNQGETEQDTEDPFFFNEAAYNALRRIAGKDFGHDKREWLAWWYRSRHELEE